MKGASSRTPFVVAGPSHIVHLRRAIDMGEVAAPRADVKWVGARAVSLFHPMFESEEFFSNPLPSLLLIPDFRIGNRTFGNPSHPAWYSGIEKRFVTPEIDRKMYRKTMETVKRVRDANPHCHFLFWSLAGREFTNMQSGRYMDSGQYRHPIWNLAEAEAEIGDNVISLQPLLSHRLAERMFKDSQLHPTNFGYRFLRSVIDDVAHLGASDTARQLDVLAGNLEIPVIDFGRPTVLTGTSAWNRTLSYYLKKGMAELGPNVEFVPDVSQIPPQQGGSKDFVWISGLSKSSAEDDFAGLRKEAQILRSVEDKGYSPRVLVWDAHAYAFKSPADRFPAGDPRNGDVLDRRLNKECGPKIRVHLNRPGGPRLIQPRDVELDTAVKGPMATFPGLAAVTRAMGGTVTWKMFEPFQEEVPEVARESSPIDRDFQARVAASVPVLRGLWRRVKSRS
ncbi:hypothetical protein GCM10009755_26800 [Brevibacterium samyangense]|uniref:SGNH/GDSL hydrolase family protein n=1 Tax=Brevibacterium samyangense TaxID=366888 RepID=A0ABN2TLL3_9MICO